MASRLLTFAGTVVKNALSPSFYKNQFNAVVDANRALIKNNSIMPGVYAILIISSGGFAIEYYGKERFNQARKRAILDPVLKANHLDKVH